MKSPHTYAAAVAVGVAASFLAQAATITVTTTENVSPPVGQKSLYQAISELQNGDTIAFNIPGAGPHIIVTPLGGYPLITASDVTIDGYTQPGSKPNDNGILGGNNAVIQIVLDSTLDDWAESPNPETPELYLRRSTRLDFSGYGTSENGILGVVGGDNFKVRGLSFIARHTEGSDSDPSIYAIALVQEAKNAKVQGCWFGLAPGDDPVQDNIRPCSSAVAAFRYRTGGDVYSGGLVVGTDGDGTNDPAEFNVILGCHIALALEAPDVRVSGNYVNVFPNGVTFVDIDAINWMLQATGRTGNDASVEFFENGRQTDNTIIGTNGDGKSDGNERNVVGHSAYDVDIEFYSNANNVVVAGNYFGVGIDGTTASPVPTVAAPNFMSLPGTSSGARVGTNGDGKSDSLENNLIVNLPGMTFVEAGATVTLTARRDRFVNAFLGWFPFEDGNGGRNYVDYYANALIDSTDCLPVITEITDGIMKGTLPAPNTANYANHVVDIYVADPKSLESLYTVPGVYAGSFVEGSTQDKDPVANQFSIDLKGLPIAPGAYVAVAVTYTKDAAGTSGTNSITGPLSAAVEANIPVLVPGSIESVGLQRIVPDTPIALSTLNALGNWEPYASVLGNSAFLIEANTFAKGFEAPSPDGKQRFVVALQPVDGKAGKTVEAFATDDGVPYDSWMNASRQNGNPGRVAGDKRPGAMNYMAGAEASPHVLDANLFNKDGRWSLGLDRGPDSRYGCVQTYALDLATLTPTALCDVQDSANGRLTSGTAYSEASRFGGELAALSNGNFVSVVEDRSRTRATENCTVATIFAPDGTVVKDSFVVAKSDIWSNVAAYKDGFAVRCKPADGSATRVLHLFDNAGNPTGTIAQTTSGESFDTGRGDGTRIAGHINSPYVFLAGKVTTATTIKLVAWDTRDQSLVAVADVSEPAFTGAPDRVNLAVDALNRVTVGWVSQPEGYESQQVAARVMVLNEGAKTITPLTASFLPFINAAKTGGIRSVQMSVAMTTRQICIAAKGEINLNNKPEEGAAINQDTGEYLKEINFYTVFTHPAPENDPTPPVTSEPITLAITRGAGTMAVSWTPAGGTLQYKNSLMDSTWTAVGTANPATIDTTSGTRFFRVMK
ncbi:MAG TPA: hypothetical protein PKM73_04445 [Verrucomicrobiota bacterium]|nr:hypothetical protein [Verrucomicrobiota bacterium]